MDEDGDPSPALFPTGPAPYDGRRFRNQVSTDHGTVGAFLKWQRTRKIGPWKDVTDPPQPPPPPRVGEGTCRVTFIGHATLLVQLDGVNLVTDPHWSLRASPVSFAGPRRMRPPGLPFDDLPPIDVVLLSHDHYDHLDVPTLRRLVARDKPVIVTGRGNAGYLHGKGILGGEDLDWWESTEAAGLEVTAVPAQHFSGRGLHDRDARLWVGLVVRGRSHAVYFAGDTGWGPHFEQIRAELGPMDLSLLPIGAYEPRWFMRSAHIDPNEAVKAHRLLESRVSVGMHFGSFALADDGMEQPVTDLAAALDEQGVSPDAFWVLEHGEGRDVPAPAGLKADAAPSAAPAASS